MEDHLTSTPVIQVRGLTKSFVSARRKTTVVAMQDVSFEVSRNEFVCIIGPSGCGKTTLLRVLGGLVPYDSGEVKVDGQLVTQPGPDRAIVFQDFALLPWMTVLDNVAFPLEIRGISKAERHAKAREWLKRVGLTRFEDHYPYTLSGGMKQRVGLARALVVDPDTLLMDEPFGALDAQTRQLLQDELLELWQHLPKTVVLITHDMHEAVYLSDRIIVMSPRPGHVAEDITVDLPRPRHEGVRKDPRFSALVEDVWVKLRELAVLEEVMDGG